MMRDARINAASDTWNGDHFDVGARACDRECDEQYSNWIIIIIVLWNFHFDSILERIHWRPLVRECALFLFEKQLAMRHQWCKQCVLCVCPISWMKLNDMRTAVSLSLAMTICPLKMVFVWIFVSHYVPTPKIKTLRETENIFCN